MIPSGARFVERTHRRHIYTVISRQRVLFLWPARMPTARRPREYLVHHRARGGRIGDEASVRVKSNTHLGAYETEVAENQFRKMTQRGRRISFEEMLQIAFQKTGLWIGSFDHPLIKQLRGTA